MDFNLDINMSHESGYHGIVDLNSKGLSLVKGVEKI